MQKRYLLIADKKIMFFDSRTYATKFIAKNNQSYSKFELYKLEELSTELFNVGAF